MSFVIVIVLVVLVAVEVVDHIRDSCRNLANWIQTMSHSELEGCQSPNESESDGEEFDIGSVIVVQTADGMKVIHCEPKTVHVSESDEEEYEIGRVRIVETEGGYASHTLCAED